MVVLLLGYLGLCLEIKTLVINISLTDGGVRFGGYIIAGQFEAHKNTQDVIDTPITVLMSPNKQGSIDSSETSVVFPINLYEKMRLNFSLSKLLY